jgi:hypothetical protein
VLGRRPRRTAFGKSGSVSSNDGKFERARSRGSISCRVVQTDASLDTKTVNMSKFNVAKGRIEDSLSSWKTEEGEIDFPGSLLFGVRNGDVRQDGEGAQSRLPSLPRWEPAPVSGLAPLTGKCMSCRRSTACIQAVRSPQVVALVLEATAGGPHYRSMASIARVVLPPASKGAACLLLSLPTPPDTPFLFPIIVVRF